MENNINKKIIFIILISILSQIIFSEEIVTTKDGKKVLLKSDGKWEYIIDNNIDIKYAEDAVIIWNTYLEQDEISLYKDIIKRDVVKLFVHYQNLSDKKIIGISFNVKITNTFGKVVFNTNIDDEVILKPKEKLKNTNYWYWEDNPFINDEPYDRLLPLAINGTAKISINLLKVFFDDGTILLAKDTK